MSPAPPERVRVTGPPRRTGAARRPGTPDIDAGTRVGDILMGSLVGEQRRLALGVLLVLALTVGALPLLFHLAPHLAEVRLLGVPIPWLLLGVLVYPLLLLLGWVYVRRAEANEADFADLVAGTLPAREDGEQEDGPAAETIR
ncbi:hypothetical protein [Nocardioides campestrisoli]|uniref:hypothetical protein n=1 Tax=Nocardioides campestrisoli TaxID=2736757 RepID=UPI001C6267BA|nr:hypothetical protein [Nocardioides campestrisoli]